MELDQIDKTLLNSLQRDARLTSEQLAQQVGLSASAVQRRLKRLRSTAIESEVAILSPEACGMHFTIIVDVEFEKEDTRLLNEFKEMMNNREEVIQCYQTAGRTDFVLIITVKTLEDYNAFAEECFLQNRNLRRYQTNVVLDRVKVGFRIPI